MSTFSYPTYTSSSTASFKFEENTYINILITIKYFRNLCFNLLLVSCCQELSNHKASFITNSLFMEIVLCFTGSFTVHTQCIMHEQTDLY